MEERKPRFTSLSGLPIARVYSLDDLKGWTSETDLGRPGESPYTRGVYATMYRGRLWTMRQFAGLGTAEDPTGRFAYLVQHGQTGLSVAFDLPTLMGLDSDDPRARGEVGYCGVAISSLEDMDRLFDRIPLDQVTTSMTINGPAAVLFAMYLAVAERRGIPFERLGGTLPNDILNGYNTQKRMAVPAGAAPPPDRGYHQLLRQPGSEVAPRQYQRLSHPRSRLDGRAGAGLHAVRRAHLCGGGGQGRSRRGRLRAAALILLQRAQRLLRGGRQVPRGPPPVGARNGAPPASERPALIAAPVPCPDRGLLAHGPAANEQRRPHHAAGTGGGAGWRPVAPHQLDGRDSGSTDRGGGQAGAQDPANHRARERSHEHRGPTGRLLLRRVADEPSGRRGPRVLPKTRRDGRHGPCDRAGIPPTGNIERVAALPAGSGTERTDRRRRQRVCGAGRAAYPDPEDRA